MNIIIQLVDTTNASFVATRDEIAKLINETNILTAFAKEGKLDERSDISKYTGAYRDLLDGINLSFAEIASPMQHSTQIINELAKGDFSVGMRGEYRGVNLVMQDSINKLIDTMNHVFADIKSSLGATKSTANDISKMSEDLVHDAHNQKSEIEEVASAIEEMSRTILGTTQNITNVSKLSMAAVDEAVRGDKKIGESKEGMLEAKRLAGEAEQVINSLVKKTEQIGHITRVIDEISEQTNLLALNAAIEAARAGENGRGFAIVADEVRKLADRTGKATQEIAVTIKSIQVEAEKANIAMATAGQSVANGMNLTEELNLVLQKMSKAVSVVSDEMNQLAAAAEQQSATAEQICKNMGSISSVTDRFVSGTVEFDNTADQLRKLTDGLNDSISRFKVKGTHNSGIAGL